MYIIYIYMLETKAKTCVPLATCTIVAVFIRAAAYGRLDTAMTMFSSR